MSVDASSYIGLCLETESSWEGTVSCLGEKGGFAALRRMLAGWKGGVTPYREAPGREGPSKSWDVPRGGG